MSTVDAKDRAAFAIFRVFIAGAVGTCRYKRDEAGNLIEETPADAAARRWADAPEKTRESFRREAVAAVLAWEQAA